LQWCWCGPGRDDEEEEEDADDAVGNEKNIGKDDVKMVVVVVAVMMNVMAGKVLRVTRKH
jgi:hypothetical protein